MVKEPYIEYDPKEGIATCIVYDNNKPFVGIAQCHPDDKDMMNEKTGCEIAFRRATISALQTYKNDEIKPALAALNQLYYSMKHSTKFNPKSYEAKMLFRQINQKTDDLDLIKEMIANEKLRLQQYINDKDEFYQQVRKNRDDNK